MVFGGANVGLMGVVADACLSEGGRVVGIIPSTLLGCGIGHSDLTESRVVDSMGDRMEAIAEIADGYVVLPGGIGTFEETFSILTSRQLGMDSSPIGLLDVDGFFSYFQQLWAFLISSGFVSEEHRRLFSVANSPEDLLAEMSIMAAPRRVDKWRESRRNPPLSSG